MSTVEYGMDYREYGMGYGVLRSKKKKKKERKRKNHASRHRIFTVISIFSPPRNSRLDRQVPKGPTTSEASGGFLDGECQKKSSRWLREREKGQAAKKEKEANSDWPRTNLIVRNEPLMSGLGGRYHRLETSGGGVGHVEKATATTRARSDLQFWSISDISD